MTPSVDERVAVLETRVDALEGLPSQIRQLEQGQTELRGDMKHLATGAARLTSAVDELRGIIGASATTSAAATATIVGRLDAMAVKRWPPAAIATVVVGVLAFVGALLPQVL